MDIDDCREKKKKDIVYQIEESCMNLDGCMHIMAECINDGEIPLTSEFHKYGWDMYN